MFISSTVILIDDLITYRTWLEDVCPLFTIAGVPQIVVISHYDRELRLCSGKRDASDVLYRLVRGVRVILRT